MLTHYGEDEVRIQIQKTLHHGIIRHGVLLLPLSVPEPSILTPRFFSFSKDAVSVSN
jgi:hypothetical protein